MQILEILKDALADYDIIHSVEIMTEASGEKFIALTIDVNGIVKGFIISPYEVPLYSE